MTAISQSQRDVPAAGRYAPSPSGPLHLGNLRTALIAWLSARSRGARFLLRIEDLDRGRCRPEHERSQIADLAALGLDWDEPLLRQSERAQQHREAFERLRAAGRVYPCWCTRADVREAASAPHLGSGSPLDSDLRPAPDSRPAPDARPDSDSRPAPDARPDSRLRPHSNSRRYPGTCRELSGGARRERARQAGRPPAWRLDGRSQRVSFEDVLHGRREGIVDDVVVWRADDAPAYNLAVVVDDAAQSIGEVVRGDDLIDATPAQVAIASLLGIAPAVYMHVPLVLGAEGRRLAKRDGAATLSERLASGESVAETVAWMARSAGLARAGEPTTLDALLASFDPQRLAREPVVLPSPRRAPAR